MASRNRRCCRGTLRSSISLPLECRTDLAFETYSSLISSASVLPKSSTFTVNNPQRTLLVSGTRLNTDLSRVSCSLSLPSSESIFRIISLERRRTYPPVFITASPQSEVTLSELPLSPETFSSGSLLLWLPTLPGSSSKSFSKLVFPRTSSNSFPAPTETLPSPSSTRSSLTECSLVSTSLDQLTSSSTSGRKSLRKWTTTFLTLVSSEKLVERTSNSFTNLPMFVLP